MARNRNNNANQSTDTPEETEMTVETTETPAADVNETEETETPINNSDSTEEKGEETEDILTEEKFAALSLEEKNIARANGLSTADIPLQTDEKAARFQELAPPFQLMITQTLKDIEGHNANVNIVKSADPKKFLELLSEKRDNNPWDNEVLNNLNEQREKLMAEYEKLTAQANEKAQELMADEIRTPEQVEAARALVSASTSVISARKKTLADFESQMVTMGIDPTWKPGYLTDLLPVVENLKGVRTGGSSPSDSGEKRATVRLDEFHVINPETNEEKFISKTDKDGKVTSNAGMVAKELTSQLHGRGAIASTDVTKAFYDGYNKLTGSSLGYNDGDKVKPGSYTFELTVELPEEKQGDKVIKPAKTVTFHLRGVKNGS